MNCNICKSLRIDGATGYAEPVCVCNWKSGGTTYVPPKQEAKVSETKFELCERLGLKIQLGSGYIQYSDGKGHPLDCTVRADELEALLQTCLSYTNNPNELRIILQPADQRVSRSRINNLIQELKADSIFVEKQDVAIELERILKHGLKD